MGKKALRIALAATILLVIGIAVFVAIDFHTVKPFSLQDYTREMAAFAENEFFKPYVDAHPVRPVETAKEAKQVAEELWTAIYEARAQSEKPYYVSYDEVADVWLVQGSADYFGFGGTAAILIRADGTILAIWHGK